MNIFILIYLINSVFFFYMTFIQLFINGSIQWVCYGFAAMSALDSMKKQIFKNCSSERKERIYNVYKLTGSHFENNVLLIKISNKSACPPPVFRIIYLMAFTNIFRASINLVKIQKSLYSCHSFADVFQFILVLNQFNASQISDDTSCKFEVAN